MSRITHYKGNIQAQNKISISRIKKGGHRDDRSNKKQKQNTLFQGKEMDHGLLVHEDRFWNKQNVSSMG